MPKLNKIKKEYGVSLTEVAVDKTNEILQYGAKKSGLLNELLLDWLKQQGWIYNEEKNKMEEKR